MHEGCVLLPTTNPSMRELRNALARVLPEGVALDFRGGMWRITDGQRHLTPRSALWRAVYDGLRELLWLDEMGPDPGALNWSSKAEARRLIETMRRVEIECFQYGVTIETLYAAASVQARKIVRLLD